MASEEVMLRRNGRPLAAFSMIARSMMVIVGHINAAELRALAASIDNLSPKRSVFHVGVVDVAVENNDFGPDFECGARAVVAGIRGSE